MEALAETLWEAQRGGRAPDERRYLELARRRVSAGLLAAVSALALRPVRQQG